MSYLGVPRGKGNYRHGEQGRFGGAQRPRDRLAEAVYLDTVDYAELCSGACAHALDCAVSFRLASILPASQALCCSTRE